MTALLAMFTVISAVAQGTPEPSMALPSATVPPYEALPGGSPLLVTIHATEPTVLVFDHPVAAVTQTRAVELVPLDAVGGAVQRFWARWTTPEARTPSAPVGVWVAGAWVHLRFLGLPEAPQHIEIVLPEPRFEDAIFDLLATMVLDGRGPVGFGQPEPPVPLGRGLWARTVRRYLEDAVEGEVLQIENRGRRGRRIPMTLPVAAPDRVVAMQLDNEFLSGCPHAKPGIPCRTRLRIVRQRLGSGPVALDPDTIPFWRQP